MSCCRCNCECCRIRRICKEVCGGGTPGPVGPAGADGISPNIGENGNWWIGNIDTGIVASGTKGDTGDDGLSAYEVAVKDGYIGTEQEWLASLKGDKGDKGDPGSQSSIVGIEAFCTTSKGTSVYKVPFDDVLRDNTEGIVEIQPDGTIIFHENGLYHIDWQVTYNDQTARDEIQCSFFANNGSYERASTVGSFGQISGSAWFITALYGIEPPIYGGLTFNGSTQLAETDIQANIVIIKMG